MKNNRQSNGIKKSSRILASIMALLMITALILPMGAKASETADGSASGASQAVAEEHTEKEVEQDSSDSDAKKEEEEKAEAAETEEKEQKSDSSADTASEDSSDSGSESGIEKDESKEESADESAQKSKEEAGGSDPASGKDASGAEEDKDAGKNSNTDPKDSEKTDSGNESAKTDAAQEKDAASGKSVEAGTDAGTSEETAEQVTAVVENDETTITFQTEEVTVIADKKAFDTEVTMKVKKVTDPGQLLKMVTALQEEGGSYTVKAYNVSFYDQNGKEVEPKIPVQVNVNTKVSAPKKTKVVHVKDNDKTEILDADIDRSGASFELGSFSDIGVATEGKAKIPGSSFDLYLGDELTTDYTVDDLPAGPISEKDLPAVDGYTYENATVGEDQVEEIGTITDEEGNVYVYYTTRDENGTIKAEILGDGRIRINLVETDQDTTYDLEVDGTRVQVTAPAGAFKPGTSMEIRNVDLTREQKDSVLAAADRKPEKDPEQETEENKEDNQEENPEDTEEADSEKNVQAVDISFYDENGKSVQPAEPVEVRLSPARPVGDNCCVIHLDENGQASPVEAVQDEDGRLHFAAESFSIYAVVDDGSTEDEARMTLNFYNGQNLIATMYVKNSDSLADLEKIIYDPGAGELGENESFWGWIIDKPAYTVDDSENAKNIGQIREWAEAEDIAEGEVHNIYAMIYKTYAVLFKDEDGVTIHSESLVSLANETLTYTLNTPYTPKSQDAEFQGWTTQDNVVPTDTSVTGPPYPNGTELQISSNVVFTPRVPHGYWLSFEENGSGASYTPPQFIESGDVTTRPSNPTRFGYTFGGWYTNKECTGSQFTFGQSLSAGTTVYAKWTPVATANYTVIIWKQNVDGTGYDFAQSITLSGTVNSNVNTVSQRGPEDNAYARINGTNYQYTGFHLKNYDAPVTITPEGNAVVNVYYDRNEYTLTFQDYTWTVSTNDNDNNPAKYGVVNNQRVRVYRNNWAWRLTDSNYGEVYNGTVYTRNNTFTTIKTIKALYEQNIRDQFPIVGTNGFTYATGTRWMPQSNLTVDGKKYFTTDVVVSYIDQMTPGNMTLRWNDPEERTDKTMVYWIETINNTPSSSDVETITYNGKLYEEYKTVVAKYNGVTVEDFFDLDGFSHVAATNTSLQTVTPSGTNNYYRRNSTVVTEVYFFYSRNKYVINYMDGVYVDGNNNHINETNHGQWATSGNIYYQADISSYNKGGANFYEPARAGYAFEGWYLDDACTQPYTFTTMPKGGMTVYAKWRKIQYRVFLHPNVPTSDTSFEMGNQETSFRVNNGEKIAGGSAIYGTRDEYDLIGWYTDEGCTKAFNFEAYTLNETNVTTPYDQTQDTELNKYGDSDRPGYNSDNENNRFWITKKLDLYAKWRAKLPGAKGIQVIYSANDTKNNINGTNAPTDPIYYLDSAEAIAGAASTPSDNKYQFLYWVVQTWDEISGKYVDTDKVVYPGASFEVLKANAQQRNNPEWIGPNDTTHDQYLYTVQLRAEYGPKEEPRPVHIYWYPNTVDINGNPIETTLKVDDSVKNPANYSSPYTDAKGYFGTDQLMINEAEDIPGAASYSYPGYTFKGWIRADTTSASGGPWLKYTEGSGYTVDRSGTDTPVSQVAADETGSVQNMIAVWEKSTPYLNVVKTEAGDNSSTVTYLDGAKFTLYKKDGSGNYQTVQADLESLESAGATGVRFTEALADGDYKLTETQAPQNHKIDTPEITFTVTGSVLQSTTEGITFDYSIDNDGNNVYTVTVENTRTATVTVTKEVAGLEADQSTGFEFTIKGVAASDQTETLYGRAAEGKKHTVTYENIPYGTEITVTETANDEFSTAYTLNNGTKQDGTSKIFVVSDETVSSTTNTAELVFTNTRKNVKLKVDKVVENGTSVDLAREFSFNWQAESGNTTVKSGTFTLTAAADPVEIEVPAGTKLTVTETIDQSLPYTTTSALGDVRGTAEFVLDSVSVDNDSQIITFTNTRQTGSASVTKIVAGNMGEKDKAFSFTASLKDGDTPLYLVKNGSTITVGTQETGALSVDFECKHNETMSFTGLPVGAVLTITEDEYGEYQQTYTIGSADAVTGRTAELTVTSDPSAVTFTNTKTAVAPTQLHSGTGPMAVLVVFSLGALILLAAHHFIDRFRHSNNM